MSENPRFEKAARRIRHRRYKFLTVLFLLPAVVALAASQIERTSNWTPLLYPLALFLVGISLQRNLQSSRCPRCGKPFFTQVVPKGGGGLRSAFSFPPESECRNCGLSIEKS